jgi:tetratricopeptide (TPR) repeat protein
VESPSGYKNKNGFNKMMREYQIYKYKGHTILVFLFGVLDYFKTAELWMKAYNLNPSNEEIKGSVEMLSEIFFNEGNKFFKKKQIENSVRCYLMSVELNRGNVEAWYNLGGLYFLYKDEAKGIEAWKNVYTYNPNHEFNKEQFYLD